MKNFRLAVTSLSLGAFLFSATGFSSQRFVKMTPDEFHRTLTERCLKTEGCKPAEIDHYMDGLTREIRMTRGHQVLLEKGRIQDTIDGIVRQVEETGIKIVSVTIKAGEKVVEVTGDQLEKIYELPAVQAMVRAGEKTLELTFHGIEYSIDVTVKLAKKSGIYQVTKIAVRTIGNVTREALQSVAKGTIDAIDYVVSSKPVVLIVDGIEYLAQKIKLNEIANKLEDLTWKSVEVFAEGTWNAVKFTYKGTLFILGLPVELVKWVIRH
ncbi:MAG: hypothetical protein RJB38_1579 [Pseudomonadota bacterium]